MTRGAKTAAAQPRFYVVAAADAGARERLDACLGAAKVACVLIVPGQAALDAASAKPLVDAAQKAGVAALVQDDAALARTLRADGVHLCPDAETSYSEAREILGTRFMVGVATGQTRHEAMEAGEAGADYVAFEAQDATDDAFEALIDQIQWWSEIFEVPCVAFGATSADEARALAAAGADFVAMALPRAVPPADAARWSTEMAQALGAVEVAS